MLEVVDLRTKRIFVIAQRVGVIERADAMGPEHLLAALLLDPLLHEGSTSSAVRILEALDVPVSAARLVGNALRGHRKIQPIGRLDAEALAVRGIDLDSLVPLPTSACPQPWWRRKRQSAKPVSPAASSSFLPFTATSKQSLECMRREAIRLGDRFVGSEHLLLGLARHGDARVNGVLGLFGSDLKHLRSAVEATVRRPDQMGPAMWSFERAQD